MWFINVIVYTSVCILQAFTTSSVTGLSDQGFCCTFVEYKPLFWFDSPDIRRQDRNRQKQNVRLRSKLPCLNSAVVVKCYFSVVLWRRHYRGYQDVAVSLRCGFCSERSHVVVSHVDRRLTVFELCGCLFVCMLFVCPMKTEFKITDWNGEWI